MIRIGIVGENYHNDSIALKNLLKKRYDPQRFRFIPLLRGTTGDKLESKGIKRLLEIELAKKNRKGEIHFIIFFRDLDSLPSDEEKIKARQDWFDHIKLHELDTLFIAIFESEALLLADIQAVNSFYNLKIKAPKNPLWQEKPKEWLKGKTKEKYKESDCADIFSQISIKEVIKKPFRRNQLPILHPGTQRKTRHMTKQELYQQIRQKQSYLCIGLDTDLQRIPKHLLKADDPIFAFNKQIIDATKDLCVAYKPNLAFYEAQGVQGWEALEKTISYIPREHFIIADAKRGDIGNTSRLYAQAFFEQLDVDAVTVAPYMGEDSVKPFLGFPGKWVILLALTSNPGSKNFQLTPQENGEPLYEKVMRTAATWGNAEELMFVVGATHPEKFREIRAIAPEHFLLVPGIGAQGGDLEAISRYGFNDQCGLLVNSSRSIIYAGDGEDFATKARNAAQQTQQEMAKLLPAFLR